MSKKKNKNTKGAKAKHATTSRKRGNTASQGLALATHRNGLIRVAAVALAAISMIVMNIIAVTAPLAGNDTGAISDAFPVLVTPAGYAFSIWSLIYTGVIAYTIYQALPKNWDNPRLKAISWFFVLSCVLNISWLFVWHFLAGRTENPSILPSLIVMLALLGTLIMIYNTLETGKSKVHWLEHYCVRAPFSIYLGWITLATVINTSVLFWTWGWRAGAIPWAIVALLAATVINALMLVRRRDYVYSAVAVWALFAINVKHWGTANEIVGTTAVFYGLVLLAIMLFLQDIPDMRELPEQYEDQAVN